MIHTNEPANVYYVLVSAFRAGLHNLDNLSRHRRLLNSLRNNVLEYGVVESSDLCGCYREAGQEFASEEQTIRVRCTEKHQAVSVARLACNDYEQDCVLVYKSQTHSAALMFAKGLDGWRTEQIGSLQKVHENIELNGNYTIDEFGIAWQVI